MKEIIEFDGNKNGQFKHSNKLIEAKYKLSITQQRIIMSLVSMISPSDAELRRYKINFREFAKTFNISGESILSLLEDATQDLLKKPIVIEEEAGPVQFNWISSAQYDVEEGSVIIGIDPILKPYFLNLKERYTIFMMDCFVKFKSYYSHRIYMLLKQYSKIGERKFELQKLKEILGLSKEKDKKEKYTLYSDFRARALEKAKLEINKFSDIEIDFEEKKIGKKVNWIEFSIKPNPNFKSIANSEILPISQVPDDLTEKLAAPRLSTTELIRMAKEARNENKNFVKPTYQMLFDYFLELDSGVNPQPFLDHYDSVGWKVGKNPMKDWKAAARTWISRDFNKHDFSATKKLAAITQSSGPKISSDLAVNPHEKEIENHRKTIRSALNLKFGQAEETMAWQRYFMLTPMTKTESGFKIQVQDSGALKYQEALHNLKIIIEVKS